MAYKNVNRIVFEKDTWAKLMQWRDNNKDLVRNRKDPFNEGFIDFLSDGSLYFKSHIYYVEVKYFILKEKVASFKIGTMTNMVFESWFDESLNLDNGEREAIQDMLTIYATTMAYIENFKPNIQIKTVERNENKKKSKKSSKAKKSVIKFRDTIYKIKSINTEKVINPEPKERNHYTQSWKVRGHWRTYKKSGKKVWVKEHSKGTGTVTEGKVYKI